jgi:APA family basic amino acid/polyamine antiporter
MIILLIYKPDYTFPGLGIVLLGIPVFYLWKKLNKNHPKYEEKLA